MKVTGGGTPELINAEWTEQSTLLLMQLPYAVKCAAGRRVSNPLFNQSGWLDLGLELCLFGSWLKPQGSYAGSGSVRQWNHHPDNNAHMHPSQGDVKQGLLSSSYFISYPIFHASFGPSTVSFLASFSLHSSQTQTETAFSSLCFQTTSN